MEDIEKLENAVTARIGLAYIEEIEEALPQAQRKIERINTATGFEHDFNYFILVLCEIIQANRLSIYCLFNYLKKGKKKSISDSLTLQTQVPLLYHNQTHKSIQ